MQTRQPLTEVTCWKCGVTISLYPKSEDMDTWANYAASNWWCTPCLHSKIGE